jgi:hypothetical protein
LRVLQRDTAHDRDAIGMPLGSLDAVVVAVARPGRRHDDGAIDAGLVHQRHQLLDGERLGHLRFHAGHPRPVRRLRLPQMDLRVDDQALARALRGGRLSRRLLRGRQRQPGAERAVEKIAT